MTTLSMPTPATRRHLSVLLSCALLASAGPSLAHGPTRQKVTEDVTINATADAVWAKVKNFNALKDWHPAVADSADDKGNVVGSLRTVKLMDGGTLLETLEGYDDAKKKYNYRAKDGGALPVTNYTSTLTVLDEGGKAKVEWRGAFYRGYPNNNPPPEQNDEAALAAVTGVYKSGLANLKQIMEAK
jgi:carbon monoxide dehydrogenase subunit G